MAALAGLTPGVQFIPGPAGNVADTGAAPSPTTAGGTVVDGTPVRVVTIALAAAVGLFALKAAGFRFNVGVST